MHIAHRRLNVIVSGHVLQCKGVGVLPHFGQLPPERSVLVQMSLQQYRRTIISRCTWGTRKSVHFFCGWRVSCTRAVCPFTTTVSCACVSAANSGISKGI